MFQPATKIQAKLRATLDGVSGSGKTYSSLMLARELVGPEGRIALIDTEAGSASKYAKKFTFDTVVLGDYALETYRKAIEAAVALKYDVLVIDSLSHAWAGKGGVLEKVDQVTSRSNSKNAFTTGWADMTPKHNAFFEFLISVPLHVICTMRKKSDWILADNGRGKVEPKKIGMATVQRDGVEYEFDVIADLDINGVITISKTRCEDLTPLKDSLTWADVPKMAHLLRDWLSDGAASPPPKPVITEPPKPGSKPVPVTQFPAEPFNRETFTARIAAAATLVDLARIAPDIAKLAEADKAVMRPIYGARQDELKKVAAGEGKAA